MILGTLILPFIPLHTVDSPRILYCKTNISLRKLNYKNKFIQKNMSRDVQLIIDDVNGVRFTYQNSGNVRAYCSSRGGMRAWTAIVVMLPAGENS
jgi:hypothetical protein